MTKLQMKLNSYGHNYWDFKDSKRDGVHKIANYPAMMVAPMQHKIIEDIYNTEKNITNILDPFHGSGTTLVEGRKFNLELVGIDINPLANLITKVKIEGINKKTIYNSIEELCLNISRLSKQNIELFYFNNINKWFRSDIIRDLTIIRSCIMLEPNKRNRSYFWVCFSDIVRKYSNTRSSTFKLHIKETEKINNMENDVISDYIESVKNCHFDLGDEYEEKKLIQGDSIIEMRKMQSESMDLICTSPPYGDNGTTVTYGQYSILSLLWIDKSDLLISDEYLVSNYSAIDSSSLGGKKKVFSHDEELQLPISLTQVISKISESKQVKVKNFFFDYFQALKEMIRILKTDHLMVLTLGNRRVDNVEVSLDKITKEFCLNNGMIEEANLTREIPRKRMPKRVSQVKSHGSVSSMNKEIILILRKKE